ncbi:MAG TPA: GNAT family N-acetyltransferase [Candidatus Nanoarchaeia archaeon]|nr:GNAT family N-acetyltransferase [Candidatus Nanoarchaeia archaeon]
MKIRQASQTDFETILALKLKSKQEQRKWNNSILPVKSVTRIYKEYLRKDFSDDWRSVFLAVEDTEIAGMIIGKIYRSLRVVGFERIGHISNLYVTKKYRRTKVAQKLVARLNSWFKSKKAHKVSLELYEKNLPAIRLYRKLGFKTYSIKMHKKI